MKRPVLILFAVISILISCQLDKSGLPASTNNTTIDGMWYLKSQVTAGIIQGYAGTPDTATNFTKSDYDKFNPDNTVNISMTGSTNITTVYYAVTSTQYGQTLTLGTTPAGTAYTINKLTKDSLILYTSVSVVSSGVTITTNTSFIYTH